MMSPLLWRRWAGRSCQWLGQIFQSGIKKSLLFCRSWAALVGFKAVSREQLRSSPEVRRLQEPTLTPVQQEPERLSSACIAAALSQVVEGPEVSVTVTGTQQATLSGGRTTGSAVQRSDGNQEGAGGTVAASANDRLLILYVVAHQQDRLYGKPLLRSLLQLGFRHGERSIFHRHLNPLGSGPILFSVVNMVKPGSFNPTVMHEFTTPGVAFYMTIPTYGDTMQNFKLMLQAAQKLADDVSGIVLDDQRHLLTLEQSEAYKARIRQFLSQGAPAAAP